MGAVLDTAERRANRPDSPPRQCPDCGGPTAWELHARVSPHAPLDGRLRLSEVIPRLVLVCDECGEPLWVVESDEELASITRPVRPIVIHRRHRRGSGLLGWTRQ